MSIKLEMQVSIEDIEKALSEAHNPNINIKKQINSKAIREKSSINIQKQVCNNIKSKITKNSYMRLEQEEVLEDNSILLTISI